MPIAPGLDAALDDALQLARLGDAAATRQRIESIRRDFDVHRAPQATLQLMLAEGIMLAYDGDMDGARDRMRRALALCALATEPRHAALAHAWTAFLDYSLGELDRVAEHAVEAMRLGQGVSRPACARAASLIGMLHNASGAGERASAWFGLARRLASADQDGAMTSAIIFNMAASRFAAARVRQVGEGEDAGVDGADLLFLQSSRNYDDGRRLDVQGYLHRMLQGFALAATGEHRQALDCLSLFGTEAVPAVWRDDALIAAERAWCALKSGDAAAARALGEQAERHVEALTEAGERLIAHQRLRDVASELGDVARAERHATLAAQALQQHRDFQLGMRQRLARLAADPEALAW